MLNLRFFEWLTLHSWAHWGIVESTTHPRPVPGIMDVPVKIQLCILKTVRLNVEFTFFEWLALYSWATRQNIKSTTFPGPVPGSHWRACEVSALYLANRANACWINFFWVINPLFLSPLGYCRIDNPYTTCPGESLTFLWSFSSVSWKLCEWMLKLRFLMINPLFLSPLRYRRIANLFTTCPEESLPYLWSFSSVS